MLARMRLDEEAKLSPILEGVQAIAVRDFGPDAPQGPKTLIVVSDLLQNQEGFSLYQGVPLLDVFWATPYATSLRANLDGYRGGLEAAFVEYGTERHGFLPFKEVSRAYFRSGGDAGRV